MAVVEMLKDRPPFVRFEWRLEEDRTASIEAGHYVGKEVAYALITPMGSKDLIERKVEEWLAKLSVDVREGRFPAEWLSLVKTAYKDWLEGAETPVDGFPIAEWPVATPLQIKTLLSLHVRSVEDLAVANEETLGRLGMGGRALKQKAIDWLAGAQGQGKVVEEMAALRTANSDLKARNESLETRIKALETKFGASADVKVEEPHELKKL